jgi:hypothetical protein
MALMGVCLKNSAALRRGGAMRRIHKGGLIAGFLVMAGLAFGVSHLNAQQKRETIQAQAWGKDRLAGRTFNMTIVINSYSTPQDQKTLLDAFNSGGHDALVRALQKMPSRGRIAMTGTLGTDIAYVRSFKTETGRKIRVVTDRPIEFREAYRSGRSEQYDVTIVELNIDQANQKKSTGGLIVGARVRMKNNQIEVESYGSGPWRLNNIMERE